jgi:TIR domain
MPVVYISHSNGNDATATRIHFALVGAGIDTYVDHIHSQAPENTLTRYDMRALTHCDCGLFVLSEESVQSVTCTQEWQAIHFQGKRLFVAIIEQIAPDDLPELLWDRTIPYIDLTRNIDNGLVELIHAIEGQISS